MRIGFIGAGKVGFTFGKYIASKMPLRAESDASSKMDQDKNKPEDIQLEIGAIIVPVVKVPEQRPNLPIPWYTTA